MSVTVQESVNRVIVTDPGGGSLRVVSVGVRGPRGEETTNVGNIQVGIGVYQNQITVQGPTARDLLLSGNTSQPGSNIEIGSNVVPDADSLFSLGTLERKWKDIYVSGGTIFLGGNSSISESTISLNNFSVSESGSISIPGVEIVADANAEGVTTIIASDLASNDAIHAITGEPQFLLTSANANLVVAINEIYDAVNSLGGGAHDEIVGLINTVSANVSAVSLELNIVSSNLDALTANVPATLLDLNIEDGDSGQVLSADGDGTFSFISLAEATSSTLDSVVGIGNVTSNVIQVGGIVAANGQFSANTEGVWASAINSSNVSSDAVYANVIFANTYLNFQTGSVETENVTFTTAGTLFDTTVASNVSVGERTISLFEKNSFHFAKLLVNVEDLTYGQYQSSEILLTHDGSSVKLTEYAIIHTSTNPFVTFNAFIESDNVTLTASTQSSDNLIKVTRFLN